MKNGMTGLRGGAVAACAAAAVLAPAFAPASAAEAAGEAEIAVVLEMVDAWNAQDWSKVVDLFADDGVLHSMMIDPIVGKESIRNRINHMGEGIESIELHVKNVAFSGEVVFIERVDEFVYKGHAGAVPVAGVIEIENGLVKEWREYYDRAELLEAMGVTVDFDAEAR